MLTMDDNKKKLALAPCDFFSQVKAALKRTTFQLVDPVKQKATEPMIKLTENDFQHYFDHWIM